MHWKDAALKHNVAVMRLAEEFEVSLAGIMPNAKCRIRVFERPDGKYLAFPNVAVLVNGAPDWIGGAGDSVADALDNCLKYFFASFDRKKSYLESEIEWSDPVDF